MDNQDLKDKLAKHITEAQEQLTLYKEFPDLHEWSGRWSTYLCSKTVNAIAEDVAFAHSCGCCEDSVLYAMPYVKRGKQIIYSDPAQIGVGERAGYGCYGERAWDGWEKRIAKYALADNIIAKIRSYFEDNPVEGWENDE